MLAIALAEFRMLLRNRLVALLAVITPLAFGVVLLLNEPAGKDAGVIAVLQAVIMVALGVYLTGTTTLAARRQTLFLKRLRSGAVSDGAILAALLVPLVLVSMMQVCIVLGALAATASAPRHPWLVAVSVLAAQLMFAGFALATASVTNSPEHAQVTTLPLFAVTLAGVIWVGTTGVSGELGWLKLLVPGGGLAEMVALGWAGDDLGSLPGAVVPSVVWAALAAVVGRGFFRWEPRA
jgi:ABC-2 type transport system permease protein